MHEWGTFTVLQDEKGDAIPGINIDDEPVPAFRVSELARLSRSPAVLQTMLQSSASQVPSGCGDAAGDTSDLFISARMVKQTSVDVDVEFPSGWITEYYPGCRRGCAGSEGGPDQPRGVGETGVEGVQVGGNAEGPATDSHVWKAPREVDARIRSNPEWRGRAYLFYRGVANLEAPV